MIYEITLTNNCTRSCSFCTLEQSSYVESLDNIKKYYKLILTNQNNRGNKYFIISLFGGEPLLNIPGVKLCIDLFKNKNCDIWLYTNGDLINSIYNELYLQYLNIQISAYDIFNNVKKYQVMINNLKTKCKYIQLAYTFSENDIHNIDIFINICKELNINYKISFSHTLSSWKNITNDMLYNYIFKYYLNTTLNFYNNNFSFILPNAISKPFTQATDLLFNYKSNIKTCISKNKMVFANGLYVGSCIKLFKKNIIDDIPYNCIKCLYKNVCSKSCLAEHINKIVPEKLCIIEKSKIDVMMYIIDKYASDIKMKKLVQYQIDKMNNSYI